MTLIINYQLFFSPQPYASWTKNTTTATWVPPITTPSVETYLDDSSTTQSWLISWNETAYQGNNSKGWEGQKVFDGAKYDWNGSAWIAQ